MRDVRAELRWFYLSPWEILPQWKTIKLENMEAAVHNDQKEFAVNKGPSHTTVHHSSGFPLSVDICSYTLLEV